MPYMFLIFFVVLVGALFFLNERHNSLGPMRRRLPDWRMRTRRGRALAYPIIAIMLTVFVYGAVRFFDGPIAPCDVPAGYCSKSHQPKTAEDYRQFRLWETVILILWPTGLVGLVLIRQLDRDG